MMVFRPAALARFLGSVEDFVLGRECVHCSRALCEGAYTGLPLCRRCIAGLVAPRHRSSRADAGSRGSAGSGTPAFCRMRDRQQSGSEEPITALRSLDSCFEYRGGGDRVIELYKFRGYRRVSRLAARILCERVRADTWAIVPAPSTRTASWKRPFEPVPLMCISLGRRLGLPVYPLLEKRPGSGSQKKLDREERRRAAESRFCLERRFEAGRALSSLWGDFPQISRNDFADDDRALLLVDDVTTTGATLRACAALLSKAGSSKIDALTLAND